MLRLILAYCVYIEHSQLSYPDLEYHCTYRLAQAVLPIPSHRLNDVSTHYKIKLEHHNAESDAKAAAMIAIKLCEQFKVSSLESIIEQAGFKTGKIVSSSQRVIPFSKTVGLCQKYNKNALTV